MTAALFNQPAVRRLLRAGADAAARTVDGETALQWAEEKGHAECVRALEEHSSTAAEAAEARDAAEAALREAVEACGRGDADLEALRAAINANTTQAADGSEALQVARRLRDEMAKALKRQRQKEKVAAR